MTSETPTAPRTAAGRRLVDRLRWNNNRVTVLPADILAIEAEAERRGYKHGYEAAKKEDPRSALRSEAAALAARPALDVPLDRVLSELREEVGAARAKHAPMHSPHEGWAVILEELTPELWEHVCHDTGRSPEARKEALQIAAMGVRYILDLIDDPPVDDDHAEAFMAGARASRQNRAAIEEEAARLAPQEPTPEEPHRTREQRREFTQMLEEQQCARCDGPSHEGPCPEEPA